MVTQIIKIQVKDFEHWKAIHESKHQLQVEHGLVASHVAVEPNNSNNITLILDWRDPLRMQAYFQLPEIQQAMKDAQPTAPPEIRLLVAG